MPPVDPRGMTLENWAAFLVQDYGADFLPMLPLDIARDPDKWREWAMRVVEAPTFAEAGVPGPSGFPDWLPWAERLAGLTVS